jgi:hypothetical protein
VHPFKILRKPEIWLIKCLEKMVKHLMAIFLYFQVAENEHHFSLFSSRDLFHESNMHILQLGKKHGKQAQKQNQSTKMAKNILS